MIRDPQFLRRLELLGIFASGCWSLATLLSFANGNARTGYTLLAIGAVAGTSIALVRTATAPLPVLEVREELAR